MPVEFDSAFSVPETMPVASPAAASGPGPEPVNARSPVAPAPPTAVRPLDVEYSFARVASASNQAWQFWKFRSTPVSK